MDTLYGLFQWKRGNFRFENRPVSYDPEFIEPLNSEFLLLDVLRMVDEWPMIAKRLSGFDMIPQKVNPAATLDALAGTPVEKSRTFQMEVIYELIDGQRSVREIIDLSFVEEFEACKNLVLLMDAGLIEPCMAKANQEKECRKGRALAYRLADAGAYLVAGALAILLFFQFWETRIPHFPFSEEERKAWQVFQESLKKVQEMKQRNAQEVFFLENGRYPQKTEDPVKKDLPSS